MDDALQGRLKAWIEDHIDELIADTVDLLKIPSLEGTPSEGAPFGPAVRSALDFVLEKAAGYGMATKDIDGFAGFAEIGAGKQMVMSLGHLDVVPPGTGWNYDPFGATQEDGWIYARGSCDDKGPTMASFFAARALAECCPDLPARVRIVFGCNEESGMACVKRYVETEEIPAFGISPDGAWPLAHAEKGIANVLVTFPKPEGSFALLEVQGGDRPNMVVDRCEARVQVSPGARPYVDTQLKSAWDQNFQWSWDGDVLVAKAAGKSAHGANPFAGDSAAIRLFRFLVDLAPVDCRDLYGWALSTMQISGAGLGINGRDEISEDLTCNIGVVDTDSDRVRLLFNIRYPVTWKGEELHQQIRRHLERMGQEWNIEQFDDSPALYFPLEHPLVRAICEVVLNDLGIETPPIVMGGGTYARVIPNTVSVGTSFAGDGRVHEADERISVDTLKTITGVYAHILWRLATLAG